MNETGFVLINVVNEILVERFLKKKIFFSDIVKILLKVLNSKKVKNYLENENIIISDYAENTEEEAVAVKKIVHSNKIILVTSAYHMYRAKLIFEKNGFNVLPYKVDFKIKKNKKISFIDFIPNSIKLENSEKGLKELFARIFYLIKFKIF